MTSTDPDVLRLYRVLCEAFPEPLTVASIRARLRPRPSRVAVLTVLVELESAGDVVAVRDPSQRRPVYVLTAQGLERLAAALTDTPPAG